MLVQLMLGHVKNAHEDHWHNLNAPSTLHAMGGLPDSMVAPVLQRIINREIDIKTANAEMQAAQREARCKKHIVIVANQLRPNVITSVDTTDFSEVVEHYPNLNLIWTKHLGYFTLHEQASPCHAHVNGTLGSNNQTRTSRICLYTICGEFWNRSVFQPGLLFGPAHLQPKS